MVRRLALAGVAAWLAARAVRGATRGGGGKGGKGGVRRAVVEDDDST